MKILFATHNKSKCNHYKASLEKCGLEFVSLDDLDIEYEVEEIGKTSQENAIQKAEEYYNLVNMPTIAVDDSLEFVGVPDEIQPGTHVRRIGGNTKATDEEMIDYYISLVKEYGEDGKLEGIWKKCIAIKIPDKKVVFHNFESRKMFVTTPNIKRNEGYPLDSISITPEYNKYTVELDSVERMKLNEKINGELFEFIEKSFRKVN